VCAHIIHADTADTCYAETKTKAHMIRGAAYVYLYHSLVAPGNTCTGINFACIISCIPAAVVDIACMDKRGECGTPPAADRNPVCHLCKKCRPRKHAKYDQHKQSIYTGGFSIIQYYNPLI